MTLTGALSVPANVSSRYCQSLSRLMSVYLRRAFVTFSCNTCKLETTIKSLQSSAAHAKAGAVINWNILVPVVLHFLPCLQC